jgi:L-ribulokinase
VDTSARHVVGIDYGRLDRLFAEYVTIHDYFGRGMNDVMRRLKALRREVRA